MVAKKPGLVELEPGVLIHKGRFDFATQTELMRYINAIPQADWSRRVDRRGRQMSVAQTCLGPWGWWTDKAGYRYEKKNPETGKPWRPIPGILRDAWLAGGWPEGPADSCLINLYEVGAKLGMHRDADEEPREAPIVSVSLGNSATFMLGGVTRAESARPIVLGPGDLLVMRGPARNRYHGCPLIQRGGPRISCTLRRAKQTEY